jgi:late competence protein required for DNA uptake (superfamily II DNA/RNA helicase)
MKKQRRVYEKKVQYESRKRVADNRPRFKGRFVSEDQETELKVEDFKKMVERHKTERHFAIIKFSRRTGLPLFAKFPNIELMNRNMKRIINSKILTPNVNLRIASECGWKH